MQDRTVTVTVMLQAKAGMEEHMRGVMKSLSTASRSEDGCLEYHAYEALIYPLVFLLYMRWRDEEAYLRHRDSPHVKEFDERYARELLVRPYDLKRWIPLEGER